MADDGSNGNDASSSCPPHTNRIASSSSSPLLLPSAAGGEEEEIVLKIVSAFYGPCEGRGDNLRQEVSDARIPYTRDVTPILRALLQRQEQQQQPLKVASGHAGICSSSSIHNKNGDIGILSPLVAKGSNNASNEEEVEEDQDLLFESIADPHLVRLKAISGGTGGMKRTAIPIQALQDGCNSMNVVFGDACPGTSKKLHIHYVVVRHYAHRSSEAVASSSEVHHVSFSEYEPVILRRNVTFYQDDEALQQATARVLAKKTKTDASSPSGSSLLARVLLEEATKEGTSEKEEDVKNFATLNGGDNIEHDDDEDEKTLLVARQMGRTDSILDFAELSASQSFPESPGKQTTISNVDDKTSVARSTASPARPTRLRSATFEIVLPVILPFLQIQERVQSRLVCRLWRNIVRDWGVASVIDSNDPTFEHAFTRPFLRGILSHSYSSLHSLRLTDFQEVCPEDLHPSLPHLRKLRVLDISRCIQLQDETLKLLAQHVSSTLEVLYIKGLNRVSDEGLIAICESCTKLKVLEVSHIPITDKSGMAIGTHLINLRALYMRDNFRLTNKSIDNITANCIKLSQLTLWGCIKLNHLCFDGSDCETATIPSALNEVTGFSSRLQMVDHQHIIASGKLVSLSLWGCLKLGDDIAMALGNMKNLRSLVVSECHRLTDRFAIKITQYVPQLVFLHLRYCKRITDDGVNAIASGLQNLYSLDLSFCSRVTSQSICTLLDARRETLSELRLQECRQLNIARDPGDYDDDNSGWLGARQNSPRDGQAILKLLRTPAARPRGCSPLPESNISMLDLRCCGGQPIIDVPYSEMDPFVRGMKTLQFEQKAPGFFTRPARWNDKVQTRLIEQLDANDRIVL